MTAEQKAAVKIAAHAIKSVVPVEHHYRFGAPTETKVDCAIACELLRALFNQLADDLRMDELKIIDKS